MKAKVNWKSGYEFEGEAGNGYKFNIGSPGTEDYKGVSPKALLLYALAGCTMYDVVMILQKGRKGIENFYIEAEGDLNNEQPSVFEKVMLSFYINGNDLDEQSVKRAIELSRDKYCAVSKMLGKAMQIDYKFFVNQQQ